MNDQAATPALATAHGSPLTKDNLSWFGKIMNNLNAASRTATQSLVINEAHRATLGIVTEVFEGKTLVFDESVPTSEVHYLVDEVIVGKFIDLAV